MFWKLSGWIKPCTWPNWYPPHLFSTNKQCVAPSHPSKTACQATHRRSNVSRNPNFTDLTRQQKLLRLVWNFLVVKKRAFLTGGSLPVAMKIFITKCTTKEVSMPDYKCRLNFCKRFHIRLLSRSWDGQIYMELGWLGAPPHPNIPPGALHLRIRPNLADLASLTKLI